MSDRTDAPDVADHRSLGTMSLLGEAEDTANVRLIVRVLKDAFGEGGFNWSSVRITPRLQFVTIVAIAWLVSVANGSDRETALAALDIGWNGLVVGRG